MQASIPGKNLLLFETDTELGVAVLMRQVTASPYRVPGARRSSLAGADDVGLTPSGLALRAGT